MFNFTNSKIYFKINCCQDIQGISDHPSCMCTRQTKQNRQIFQLQPPLLTPNKQSKLYLSVLIAPKCEQLYLLVFLFDLPCRLRESNFYPRLLMTYTHSKNMSQQFYPDFPNFKIIKHQRNKMFYVFFKSNLCCSAHKIQNLGKTNNFLF